MYSAFKCEAVDLILYDFKINCFTEGCLGTNPGSKGSVKSFTVRVEGWNKLLCIKRIQSESPAADYSGLASSSTSGKQDESFRFQQVIQTEQGFSVFLCFYKDFL